MSAPTGGPRRAGFVLAGGRSSRMGRDKALLPMDGRTLVERVASQVFHAAGTITLIGPPERYSHLSYPVIADRLPGAGPLGGVFTALDITRSDWNLIVACDMPGLTVDFLTSLFNAAETSRADCIVPQSGTGLDPLCAVYHRRCREAAASAIERKILKMQDFVSLLRAEIRPVSNAALLENVNTPQEWISR